MSRAEGRPGPSYNGPGLLDDQSERTRLVAAEFAENDTEHVITDTTETVKVPIPPNDRLNCAFVLMILLGMSTGYAWHFFVAASDYFRYSFRNVTAPEVPTPLQTVFESMLALISSGVGLLVSVSCYMLLLDGLSRTGAVNKESTMFEFVRLSFRFGSFVGGIAVNTVLTRYLSFKIRILSGLLVVVVIFIVTATLAKVDTDSWQYGFFGVTMLDIVLIRFSSNIALGGLYGVQGCLPHRFATALMVGQTIAGIFAATAEIVSVAVGSGTTEKDTIKTEACGYFSSAVLMSILAVMGFLVFLKLPIARFYLYPSPSEVVVEGETETTATHQETITIVKENFNFRLVFSRIWMHCLVALSTFFVTLSLYPAVATAVRSVSAANGSLINNGLFTPLCCFLVANSADLAGRLAHGFLRWPDPQQRWTTLSVALSRFAFIPVMLLCNAQPRSHLPVIFGDAVLVVCITMMLFTSGYLGNLVIMYGPKLVPSQFAETTGSLMGVCLSTGALLGSALSFGLIAVL